MEPSGVYFDPETGKLNTYDFDLGDRQVCPMPPIAGYFGGCHPETLEASLLHSSDEFITEVNCFDEAISSTGDFYKIQSLQTLGESNDRVSVPIWIERANHLSVASSWIPHIQQAINDINFAAPGLYLYRTTVKSKAKVEIFGNSFEGCFTRGNIVASAPDQAVEISFEHHWESKNRTSCHELLHALGFGHEHQRRDRHLSIDVPMEEVTDEWKSQYQRSKDLLGITCFDPHSIMMYPEDQLLLRNTNDPVWFTKPTNEDNEEMSELDKISLNNLYRPCKGPNYSPSKVGSKTGLWYCGRYFGVQFTGHDGYCGPTNGPNCPACRVLKSDKVAFIQRKGKWQGWTGGVYCGRWFGVQEPGHDGYCGPNNGPSCPECYHELLGSY